MKLKVRRKFDAAHYLYDYQGQCARLHGHTWQVVVTFEVAHSLELDFKDAKQFVAYHLDRFDHQCLNHVIDINPTAENIAAFLLMEMWKNDQFKVMAVEVFESDDCSVIVERGIDI